MGMWFLIPVPGIQKAFPLTPAFKYGDLVSLAACPVTESEIYDQ